MQTAKQGFEVMRVGDTGWVAVNVNHDGLSLDRQTFVREAAVPNFGRGDQSTGHLFQHSTEAGITFSERFPKLTVAMITLAMVGFTLAAEIEYLRVSGFDWR